MYYLYLFSNKDLDYHKIGYAKSPKKRLKALNVPFELEIAATVRVPGNRDRILQVEKDMHHVFRDKRIRLEWFRGVTPEEFKSKAIAGKPYLFCANKNNKFRIPKEFKSARKFAKSQVWAQ